MVRDEFSTASARWALPFSCNQACRRWRGSPAVIGGASACGARALAPEDCGSGGRLAPFLARSSSESGAAAVIGGASACGARALAPEDCGSGGRMPAFLARSSSKGDGPEGRGGVTAGGGGRPGGGGWGGGLVLW